ncbi:MAG: hypothetical protein KatS3mg105_5135 [Gemmatales bacterium]|nr:MAG: hypothetical protein KatS3mg105_5135 [Gemmatales bacterium]GIW97854.1 MAG: hypothetical protein KatS3mg111_1187 [Pirellulaceae bacterium]
MSNSVLDTARKWLISPLWHSRWQAALIIVVIVFLALAYYAPLRTQTADALWNWIDPVSGITAFFISLVVLYNQARERWENSLEKRLTVSFVNARDNIEIARVEHAYLSGQSDIRQWAQQLGRQIFGGDLQLDMNWDDHEPPRVVRERCGDRRVFVKLYVVTLYVYFDVLPSEKITAFAKRRFKHSEVVGSADSLPLRWRRCPTVDAATSGTASVQQETPRSMRREGG